MEMSYHDKEYIIVDKFSYLNLPVTFAETSPNTGMWNKMSSTLLKNIPLHIGDPVRGDVVVITPHVDRQKEYYIKRVLAEPGDTILFQDGEVLIKKPGNEKFVQIKESYLSSVNIGQTRLPENVKTNQFLIPEGYYWVM
jgi:signal peptidase I